MGRSRRTTTWRIRRPHGKRTVELLFVALVMSLLTLFIGDLPELEVVESTVNDDTFSDLVITTQGEIPIDSSILVVTYDGSILDEEQRVHRGLLAEGLAYLLAFDPAVVGVDFMIDDRRADTTSDQMLAGLIEDYRDRLIFGIYSIDSLRSATPPPPLFNLDTTSLGSVNLMPGDDFVIRTFTPQWPGISGLPIDLLSVKLAERTDPKGVAYLRSFNSESFVIDYAAGIGEHRGDASRHVFPSIPLTAIANVLFSEETDDDDAMRKMIEGKTVLVGYADIRPGQVTSLVDRFYTPLKEEENGPPDMYGVTIHANILNTILQRRIVTRVPAWVNVLWGTLIVFLMYFWSESLTTVRPEWKRTALRWGGWVLLLTVSLTLPIFLFRASPWMLSVYTPFAGLVLGYLVLGIFDRLKRIVIDVYSRRTIRKRLEPLLVDLLLPLLRINDPAERYIAFLHTLQRLFHTAADRLFIEASAEDFAFRPETVGSPTPSRLREDIAVIGEDQFSERGRQVIAFIEALHRSFLLQRSLRAARSLVIAVNEIDRQTMILKEEERAEGRIDPELADRAELHEENRDTVMTAAGGATSIDAFDGSDKLLAEMIEVIAGADDQSLLIADAEEGTPFIHTATCRLHRDEEAFVYLSEQEDANNQDDFYDLIYAGETIRCRPEDHPGLTAFREMSGGAVRRSTSRRDRE